MNVHWSVLPAPSSAVTVTVVIPTGNVLPDAGAAVVVAAPGDGGSVKVTMASQELRSLLTVWLAGHSAVGVSSFFLNIR